MHIVHHFILLGSIPLTLVLIERDGDLSTLCHSCGFDYHLRVQKHSLALAIPTLRIVWPWHLLVNLYSFFFHEYSRFTGQQKKGKGISLTPHYHFHPLYRYLYISRAITVESLPLHIASSQTQTGSLIYTYVYITLYMLILIYIC